MKKWEYAYAEYIFSFGKTSKGWKKALREHTARWLNQLGSDGWEICEPLAREKETAGLLIIGLFKREKPDSPDDDGPDKEIIIGTDFAPPTHPEPPMPFDDEPLAGQDAEKSDAEILGNLVGVNLRPGHSGLVIPDPPTKQKPESKGDPDYFNDDHPTDYGGLD